MPNFHKNILTIVAAEENMRKVLVRFAQNLEANGRDSIKAKEISDTRELKSAFRKMDDDLTEWYSAAFLSADSPIDPQGAMVFAQKDNRVGSPDYVANLAASLGNLPEGMSFQVNTRNGDYCSESAEVSYREEGGLWYLTMSYETAWTPNYGDLDLFFLSLPEGRYGVVLDDADEGDGYREHGHISGVHNGCATTEDDIQAFSNGTRKSAWRKSMQGDIEKVAQELVAEPKTTKSAAAKKKPKQAKKPQWTFGEGRTVSGRKFSVSVPDQMDARKNFQGRDFVLGFKEDLKDIGLDDEDVFFDQVFYSSLSGDVEGEALAAYRENAIPEYLRESLRHNLYGNEMMPLKADWIVQGKNCEVLVTKGSGLLGAMVNITPIMYSCHDSLIFNMPGRNEKDIESLALAIAETVEFKKPDSYHILEKLDGYRSKVTTGETFEKTLNVIVHMLVGASNEKYNSDLYKGKAGFDGSERGFAFAMPRIAAKSYNESLETYTSYLGRFVDALEYQHDHAKAPNYRKMWKAVGEVMDLLIVEKFPMDDEDFVAKVAKTGLVKIPDSYAPLRKRWESLKPEGVRMEEAQKRGKRSKAAPAKAKAPKSSKYLAADGKADTFVAAEMFQDDKLFFNDDDISWDGKRHVLRGFQVNLAEAATIPDFIEDAESLIGPMMDFFEALEDQEDLRVPRKSVHRALYQAIRDGDLTGLTLFNLLACCKAIMVRQQKEDSYVVMYATCLPSGIPAFSDLVGMLLVFMRNYNGIKGTFEVTFVGCRNIDFEQEFLKGNPDAINKPVPGADFKPVLKLESSGSLDTASVLAPPVPQEETVIEADLAEEKNSSVGKSKSRTKSKGKEIAKAEPESPDLVARFDEFAEYVKEKELSIFDEAWVELFFRHLGVKCTKAEAKRMVADLWKRGLIVFDFEGSKTKYYTFAPNKADLKKTADECSESYRKQERENRERVAKAKKEAHERYEALGEKLSDHRFRLEKGRKYCNRCLAEERCKIIDGTTLEKTQEEISNLKGTIARIEGERAKPGLKRRELNNLDEILKQKQRDLRGAERRLNIEVVTKEQSEIMRDRTIGALEKAINKYDIELEKCKKMEGLIRGKEDQYVDCAVKSAETPLMKTCFPDMLASFMEKTKLVVNAERVVGFFPFVGSQECAKELLEGLVKEERISRVGSKAGGLYVWQKKKKKTNSASALSTTARNSYSGRAASRAPSYESTWNHRSGSSAYGDWAEGSFVEVYDDGVDDGIVIRRVINIDIEL